MWWPSCLSPLVETKASSLVPYSFSFNRKDAILSLLVPRYESGKSEWRKNRVFTDGEIGCPYPFFFVVIRPFFSVMVAG